MKKVMSSSRSVLLRACLGLALLFGFLRFPIVEGRHQIARVRGGAAHVLVVMNRESSCRNMEEQEFDVAVEVVHIVKRKKLLSLNYIMKRRVPNGPDPIHNRGAGKSRRPPGHA